MYETLTKEQIAKKCYDLRTKNKRLTEQNEELRTALKFQTVTITELAGEIERLKGGIWRSTTTNG